jgi:putative membrane protein
MHLLHLLIEWVVYSVGLLIAAHLIPGFKIKSFGSAMIAVIVIGLLNVTLGLLLGLVAFPINLLTFRLFSGVISLLINACVLRVAGIFSPGFKVDGFVPALLGAIVLLVLHFIWLQL